MNQPSENFRVLIHGMAHGGEGVGRLPDGRAVFVDGVIPEEEVQVELTTSRKKWARGIAREIHVASPDRVEARCPHFEECGGCQWQHISVDRQRRLKREILIGQFEHLGKFESPPVEECLAVGDEDGFSYRNHVHFTIDEEGHCCYHRKGTRDLIPVSQCPILHPLLREWHESLPPLKGLRRLEMRVGSKTGQRLAMASGELDEELYEKVSGMGIPLKAAGNDEITEMVAVDRFRVSSKSFFQANTDAAEAMSRLVVELADPAEDSVLLDAFAGVGLFTVPLARLCSKLFAVEKNAAAIRDLRHHAKGQGVHVIGTDFEAALVQLPKKLDRIVANPPREGLGNEQARRLASFQASRIVLVSCDPAAMARDARALVDEGYQLMRVIPVDQFPQSYHIEAIALLSRKRGAEEG